MCLNYGFLKYESTIKKINVCTSVLDLCINLVYDWKFMTLYPSKVWKIIPSSSPNPLSFWNSKQFFSILSCRDIFYCSFFSCPWNKYVFKMYYQTCPRLFFINHSDQYNYLIEHVFAFVTAHIYFHVFCHYRFGIILESSNWQKKTNIPWSVKMLLKIFLQMKAPVTKT